ncbi:hypothetical protein CAC42_4483 [Sphaceloma murrayae]|uniref:Uncharacterized protein n=1 Tax=Sphaceloma murrayae TaxID=2082308 RepID=A0A2K1QMB1_9PEZI|nr:hypothetical protein CAC42_4483 [Sphaceloma murrayae]
MSGGAPGRIDIEESAPGAPSTEFRDAHARLRDALRLLMIRCAVDQEKRWLRDSEASFQGLKRSLDSVQYLYEAED